MKDIVIVGNIEFRNRVSLWKITANEEIFEKELMFETDYGEYELIKVIE